MICINSNFPITYYDNNSSSCKKFSECPSEAQYCLNDNKSFVCLNNYYVYPTDSTTIECKLNCCKEKMRIPRTMETKGIYSIN